MKQIIIFIKRILYLVINPICIAYWFIFRPKTRGVKCIVECEEQVLFVRLGYAHKGWTLPGGGVKRKETFTKGAQRELLEETGIFSDSLLRIGGYESTRQYKRDSVEIFYTTVSKFDFEVDGFEIVEARWASPSNIPRPCGDRIPSLISFFLEYKKGK